VRARRSVSPNVQDPRSESAGVAPQVASHLPSRKNQFQGLTLAKINLTTMTELSSPGSQPVTVTTTVGSRKWMFRDRCREPVGLFSTLSQRCIFVPDWDSQGYLAHKKTPRPRTLQ